MIHYTIKKYNDSFDLYQRGYIGYSKVNDKPFSTYREAFNYLEIINKDMVFILKYEDE